MWNEYKKLVERRALVLSGARSVEQKTLEQGAPIQKRVGATGNPSWAPDEVFRKYSLHMSKYLRAYDSSAVSPHHLSIHSSYQFFSPASIFDENFFENHIEVVEVLTTSFLIDSRISDLRNSMD